MSLGRCKVHDPYINKKPYNITVIEINYNDAQIIKNNLELRPGGGGTLLKKK
jgi:hypothetical protein